MTGRAAVVVLVSACILVLNALGATIVLTAIATSAVWCLIIWAVYVR